MITSLIFIVGYTGIIFEQMIKINKAAIAILTGVLCWMAYVFMHPYHVVNPQLLEHLSEISGILFFLMAATTIVELIDAHDGFDVIAEKIQTQNAVKLLWVVSWITFFLSAVLDNLTTSIVMVSLLRKLISNQRERWIFLGMVILAANAGGAWSPIGDVTTTMLWIGGQISAGNIVARLFLPSVVSLMLPLGIFSFKTFGRIKRDKTKTVEKSQTPVWQRRLVFISGLLSLLFVPVFKMVTHLPPFMGILFSLGFLWVLTELIHARKNERNKQRYSVLEALRKIDVPSVLFFLGILLAIGALESQGQLLQLAGVLQEKVDNPVLIVLILGIISAVNDNVPLTAALMGMYPLAVYPMDHFLWEFLAYAAGTGGSLLIVGSAAGVAVMGMEKIPFIWYLKKISLLALLGYLAGAAIYILLV